MNDQQFHPESGSSLWIENLVNGLSGITIKAKHPVFCGSSPFQKVEVYDTYVFGQVLCLGGTIVLTEFDNTYHEMMVHTALMMHQNPKRICIIGGGDGGCLKEVIKHESVEQIVIVEIDSLVQETIKNYFPLLGEGFDDERVELVIDDGYNYMKNNENLFDVILIDSYDPGGPVQSLETADFYSIVSTRLEKTGVTVFQTDSPLIRGEFLRSTVISASPFFARCKPYLCTIRSLPDSICSFLACAHQEQTLEQFDIQKYTKIEDLCTYYNEDVHRGAFLLPQYIKNLLKS